MSTDLNAIRKALFERALEDATAEIAAERDGELTPEDIARIKAEAVRRVAQGRPPVRRDETDSATTKS